MLLIVEVYFGFPFQNELKFVNFAKGSGHLESRIRIENFLPGLHAVYY